MISGFYLLDPTSVIKLSFLKKLNFHQSLVSLLLFMQTRMTMGKLLKRRKFKAENDNNKITQ